jgi:2-iminoacetate synthase
MSTPLFTSTTGGFSQVLADLDQSELQLTKYSSADVKRALQQTAIGLGELMALLSPAATELLPELLARASQLTRQHFGAARQLFAPLYMSNLCANECTYCGFSMSQAVKRRVLTSSELLQEAQAVKAMGHDQLLLVAGEHERKVGMAYFRQQIPLLRPLFSRLMLEVQPLATDEYLELKQLGIDTVLVYQETYQQQAYQQYHLKGKKTDLAWRLDTPDRLGQAGIDKIGLGILLGLADWRTDALRLATHLRYLQQHYWRCQFSLALPRLRPCSGGIAPAVNISDRQLVQLYAAFRIFAPEVDLTLSTREPAALRDLLLPLMITSLSAGSKTQPGGYQVAPQSLEQFSIDDDRSPAQMALQLQKLSLQPVWTNWHPALGR